MASHSHTYTNGWLLITVDGVNFVLEKLQKGIALVDCERCVDIVTGFEEFWHRL